LRKWNLESKKKRGSMKNKLRRKESASKKWLTPDIRFRMRIRSEKKNNLVPPQKKIEKRIEEKKNQKRIRPQGCGEWGWSDLVTSYGIIAMSWQRTSDFFFSMAASILSMRRATCACGCAFVDPPADRLQQDFRENVLQWEGVLIIVTIIIDGSEAIVSFSGNIYLSIPCLTFLWRVRASCLLKVFSSLQISHLTFCLFVLWMVSSWRVRS